jgi:hypothetical protein
MLQADESLKWHVFLNQVGIVVSTLSVIMQDVGSNNMFAARESR